MENVNDKEQKSNKKPIYKIPGTPHYAAPLTHSCNCSCCASKPYVPHDRVPEASETWNAGDRRFMKYNGPVYDGVEAVIPDISVHPLGTEISDPESSFRVPLEKTPLFTLKDADTLNRVQNILMDHDTPVPEGSVPPLPEESKQPQTDKQKMKEIKLAALESSKSLTRLLELLREYDV